MAKDTEEQLRQLPFSEKKQDATLGHLLTNEIFFHQARELIKPEWFLDEYCGRLWRNAQEFYEIYKRFPSEKELQEVPDIQAEDHKIKQRLITKLTLVKHDMTVFGLDTIVPELTQWMQTRIFHPAVIESAKHFNNRRVDLAFDRMKEAMQQIDTVKFGNHIAESFEDPVSMLRNEELELEGALTFGHPMIDSLLVPHAKSGSLLRGDTTVILAPVNVGKTTLMITVALHNVRAGKDVLLISHEGRPSDLMQKIWCNMLGLDKNQLFKAYALPGMEEFYRVATPLLTRHLTYIPLNKAGMTVEEVEAIIRRQQQERIAKTGKGYDLLVNDYPAKLTTKQALKGNLAKRHSDEIVYQYFVQLALEYKFHALVAIQTNRSGAKANEFEDRLLSMSDVAESWGPMTIASNVISINRDVQAAAENHMTLHICKSRSSETGYAVVMRTNYPKCMTHGPSMPACWYRGGDSYGGIVDGLLNQYPGVMVPDDGIKRALNPDVGFAKSNPL